MQHTGTTTTNITAPDMKLFYACFVALITTSFGFILRALMLPEWSKNIQQPTYQNIN